MRIRDHIEVPGFRRLCSTKYTGDSCSLGLGYLSGDKCAVEYLRMGFRRERSFVRLNNVSHPSLTGK